MGLYIAPTNYFERIFPLVEGKLDNTTLLKVGLSSQRGLELMQQASSWKKRFKFKFPELFADVSHFPEDCFFRFYRYEVSRQKNAIQLRITVQRVEKVTWWTFTTQIITAWHLVPEKYRPLNLLGDGIDYLLNVAEVKGLARNQNFEIFKKKCREYWPSMTQSQIDSWYLSLKNSPIRPS